MSDQGESDDAVLVVMGVYRSYNDVATMPASSQVVRADCGHLAWLSIENQPMVQTRSYRGMAVRTSCIDCSPPGPETLALPESIERLRQFSAERGDDPGDVDRFLARHKIRVSPDVEPPETSS